MAWLPDGFVTPGRLDLPTGSPPPPRTNPRRTSSPTRVADQLREHARSYWERPGTGIEQLCRVPPIRHRDDREHGCPSAALLDENWSLPDLHESGLHGGQCALARRTCRTRGKATSPAPGRGRGPWTRRSSSSSVWQMMCLKMASSLSTGRRSRCVTSASGAVRSPHRRAWSSAVKFSRSLWRSPLPGRPGRRRRSGARRSGCRVGGGLPAL